MKLIIFAIILIISISCNNNSTTEKTDFSKGNIKGSILEYGTGNYIATATIETEPSTGKYLSDKNGNYNITDIDTGYYDVFVSKEGYNSNSQNVYVSSGKESEADITLSKYIKEDKTAYLEIKITCKNQWSVSVTIDGQMYYGLPVGIQSYKTYEGKHSIKIHESNPLTWSCDKKYGKTWLYVIYIKRGETKQLSVECCD
jgi:hypothetical protein